MPPGSHWLHRHGHRCRGLLGDVARRRQELINRLKEEGLLEANKARPLSPVPLRVGLVASPGTEGYSDFTGQLLKSGYGFEILLVKTAVQGESAPAQIVSALETLDQGQVDLICLVRGGGSKGDLACFDDESVARAIAGASTPVFTESVTPAMNRSPTWWRTRERSPPPSWAKTS